MNKEDQKVIPLPGLHERYIEKGIEEIRDNHYADAEQSFIMALELGESTKAHFGMIMVLYQRGKLAEARKYCEKLLKQEIESKEDFFEYLQVYLTILRELKDYNRAVELLKTSLQKHYLPEEQEEQCNEWLNFFIEKTKNVEEENGDEAIDPFESWQDDFFEERQVESNIGFGYRDEIREYYMKEIDRIKEALLDEKGDPYIKSIILHDLKLNQLDVTVSVHKFGEDCSVNISEMIDVTETEFYHEVKKKLANVLESDNPTLYNMALQLWEHFMVTMFPIPLKPADSSLWAAAVYLTVHVMNGMNRDELETAERFHVNETALRNAVEKIKEAEKATAI